MPAFRDFAGLSCWDEHIPCESSILRFGKTPSPRQLLERHQLADQILATVNALLLAKGLQLKAGTVVDATLIAAPSSTKNRIGARDPETHQSKKGNQWYFRMKAHIGVDADSGLVHAVRGTAGNVSDIVEAHGLLHRQEFGYVNVRYRGLKKNALQIVRCSCRATCGWPGTSCWRWHRCACSRREGLPMGRCSAQNSRDQACPGRCRLTAAPSTASGGLKHGEQRFVQSIPWSPPGCAGDNRSTACRSRAPTAGGPTPPRCAPARRHGSPSRPALFAQRYHRHRCACCNRRVACLGVVGSIRADAGYRLAGVDLLEQFGQHRPPCCLSSRWRESPACHRQYLDAPFARAAGTGPVLLAFPFPSQMNWMPLLSTSRFSGPALGRSLNCTCNLA